MSGQFIPVGLLSLFFSRNFAPNCNVGHLETRFQPLQRVVGPLEGHPFSGSARYVLKKVSNTFVHLQGPSLLLKHLAQTAWYDPLVLRLITDDSLISQHMNIWQLNNQISVIRTLGKVQTPCVNASISLIFSGDPCNAEWTGRVHIPHSEHKRLGIQIHLVSNAHDWIRESPWRVEIRLRRC